MTLLSGGSKRQRVGTAQAPAFGRPAQNTAAGGLAWQDAASQQRGSSGAPRPLVDVGRQHQAFCKLMARAGLWEVVKVTTTFSVTYEDLSLHGHASMPLVTITWFMQECSVRLYGPKPTVLHLDMAYSAP